MPPHARLQLVAHPPDPWLTLSPLPPPHPPAAGHRPQHPWHHPATATGPGVPAAPTGPRPLYLRVHGASVTNTLASQASPLDHTTPMTWWMITSGHTLPGWRMRPRPGGLLPLQMARMGMPRVMAGCHG